MMATNIAQTIYTVNRAGYLIFNNRAYTLGKMKYGERLKLARKGAGMTQAALAEAAGLSQPTIHHLESETSEGSMYTPRLARLLKVSADWLADEIGEMCPMIYSTSDPKIIAVAKLMQDLPEYGKDAAAKDVAEVAQLIEKAIHGGNGTHG